MTHTPAPSDYPVHDRDLDVTEARCPDAAHMEVIDLLGICPGHGVRVRATLREFAVVDALLAWKAQSHSREGLAA